MKRTTTIIASLLVAVGMTAQIVPGQNHSGLKAKNDKINMSGNEALSHLMVNPNPTTSASSNLKTSVGTGSETLIGTTTYDLQSNAAVQNRIVVHADGTISAGWTISQQYNNTFSDRGTGYNFFDGTSWGAAPSLRLEDSRGGWPSIIALGNGTECAITHNTDNSYINNTYRTTTGSGSWVESPVTNSYMIWNRSAAGGLDGNTIHMIGVTAAASFGGTPFNGLDGALVYYRSQDGGNTWDITDMQLPGMDTSMYDGMNGDVYAIAAQDNIVVVAYFDDWGDSYIVKSTDNGDSWTRTTFLDFPVTKYIPDSGFDLDNNDTTDHIFSTDNYGALILDDNGDAHVFYGVMQYADDDLSDGGSSWYPGTNGIAYWNETFGSDTNTDTVSFSAPNFTVNTNIVNSAHYSLDTVWINYIDTNYNVTLVTSNYYTIILYSDSLNPYIATDTIYAWEADIYSYDYDTLGNIIDTTYIASDSIITLSYYTWSNITTTPNSPTLQDTVNYLDAAGVGTPRGRWWSDMMNDHIITVAPDLNNDGFVDGIDSTGGYALYYASRASMPNAGLDAAGNIWLSFSGYTETADNGTQVYRHLYITKSEDGGITWEEPVDVTPHDDWNGMQECVFGSMSPVVDEKIRIVYQKDFEPGLAVRGDEDMVDNNDIIYLEIDTVGLFDGPFTIGTALNEIDTDEINNNKIFDILGREWKSDFADLPKGIYIIDGKKIFKTK
jgi:hypothetical protein